MSSSSVAIIAIIGIAAIALVIGAVVVAIIIMLSSSTVTEASAPTTTLASVVKKDDSDTFVLPPLIPIPTATVALTSTFNGKKIVVQPHARLAGGIWSFTVGGKPYVTELPGNGGSLQYACIANIDPPDGSKPYSESYNPTQAGNARDRDGRTTSRWSDLAVDSKEKPTMLFSKTQMAFYTDPSNPHHMSAERGRGVVPVYNTRPVSDFVLDQFLHLGYGGMPNVLLVRYVLNVPEKLTDHKYANEVTWLIAEMPTGYMYEDISRLLQWNSSKGAFEPLPGDTGPNVESRPDLGGALATPDGAHCMGIRCIKYLPKRLNVPKFSAGNDARDGDSEGRPTRMNKWALTASLGGPKRHFHGPITTEVLLVVGTLAEVTETFKKLGL